MSKVDILVHLNEWCLIVIGTMTKAKRALTTSAIDEQAHVRQNTIMIAKVGE